ncbi:hypothetical protein [Bittarella sp. HCP28S3_D9]|uniref:hypothetical protein n=1 Tax=Bittarella sp. HCP28S3_D9 TaxID=3440253 RepID=UPI003F89F60F
MKTTTRFFQLLSLCALAALLAGCAPKEPPPLTARAGETALPTVCAKSRWGGAVYDREDVFAALAQQEGWENLPELAEGEEIVLRLDGRSPGEMAVGGWTLDEQGRRLEPFSAAAPVWDGKDGSWTVPALPEGEAVCGVLLACSWGENTRCEYAFAYRR